VLVLVVFAVGVVLAGVASSVGVLIVARAIQGAGAAILPLGFGILRDQLPRGRVGFAISATAATAGVGTGLGIVVGSAIAALVRVPESSIRSRERIDVVPALALTGWLVAVLLAAAAALLISSDRAGRSASFAAD
jgi:MFS family permease